MNKPLCENGCGRRTEVYGCRFCPGCYPVASPMFDQVRRLEQERDRYQSLASSLAEEVERLKTVPDAILEIGRRMIADLKDNDHCTTDPAFVVQRKHTIYGIDTDYGSPIAWLDEDGDEVDQEESAMLEEDFQENGEIPEGYTRTGRHEEWEHVDTYFTQQAAEARINGGPGGRVSVESFYRNHEMRLIREFLMSLATEDQPQ